jgi:predicted AAA+ superfamily ATPase
LIEPYNFIKQVHLPPTRILFVGARGTGKTSLIERLDKKGAMHVKFQEYILEYANQLPAAEKQDVLFAINEGGVLPPTFLTAAINSLYQDEVRLTM